MAEFSLVECSDNDRYLWDEFVVQNPFSHVYHLWEWGEVLCKTYKYERHYLAVKRNEDILGVFPVLFVKSWIFGKRLISLPFVEYAGPLLRKDTNHSTAELVLIQFLDYYNRLSKKLSADYTEIRQPPGFLSALLSSIGFKRIQRHLTFRIDLTKEEPKLLKDMDKKCRNSLRKAMKSGIEIQQVESDDLEQYYDLYLNAQKRLGSPPHSFGFFRNVYDTFSPAGLLQMTLAMHDAKPIGGVMVFSFKDTLYWFGNVTDRRYANLNPTNLLLWHTIQQGIENSFKVFDLGQTRKEDLGVYHFKSGWGGSEVNLEDFVFSANSFELPNPSKRKYALLSRMWSMMPTALARRIGPRLIGGIGL